MPEAALNVTLQEDKYHRHIQDLKLMLTAYDGAVASLSAVETHLLRKQLAGLQVLHCVCNITTLLLSDILSACC